MEIEGSNDIVLYILIGSFGMVILMGAVILFVLLYQKKVIKHQLEIENLNVKNQEKMLGIISDVQEEERKRIANDLHDDVGAQLSTLKLFIYRINENSFPADTDLKENIKKLIDSSIKGIRRSIKDLSPNALEKFGFEPTIRDLFDAIRKAESIDIKYDSNINGRKFDSKIELNLFRVIQEIINNTLKHAQATEIRIDINSLSDQLHIHIQDNGIGFSLNGNNNKGLGFKNIESRLYLIKGKYVVSSSPENGTSYQINVPL